jgi:hypothetical protein
VAFMLLQARNCSRNIPMLLLEASSGERERRSCLLLVLRSDQAGLGVAMLESA